MAEVIQQIGAYAGFAAIVGLAVLSALYFSQARDLRRLREWAARAPDRPSSPGRDGAEAGPGAERSPGPRATAAPARPSAEAVVPAASAAAAGGTMAGGDTGPRSQRSPAATALRAGQPASAAVGAPTQAGARPATRPPSPGVGRDASRGSSQRGPVGVARPEPRPPSRAPERSNLPYLALAIVGLLIVVGAGAFAVGLIGGPEEPAPNAGGATQTARPQTPADPASVTFSVLNGTGVDGLAKQVADELEAAGYRRGNVTNNSEQKAESVVLYGQGARADAQAVAREVEVSQIEAADPRTRSLAGDSSVVIVVGADQTR